MKVWNSSQYSEQELETLTRLHSEYMSFKDIALVLGRSEVSVKQRAYKLGLRRDTHLVKSVGTRGLDILEGYKGRPPTLHQIRKGEQRARKIELEDRRKRAIEGLLFDLQHGHDAKWAIKEAYSRGAPMTHIADAIGMSRWKVIETVKPKPRLSKGW